MILTKDYLSKFYNTDNNIDICKVFFNKYYNYDKFKI